MKPKRYFYFCNYRTVNGRNDCDVVRVIKLGYKHVCKVGKNFTPVPAVDSPKMMNKVFMCM